MSLQAVLLPVFVQVALTFVLLFMMGRSRFAAAKAGEVPMADVPLGRAVWPERPTKFANAYHNQFQLPVLFYVLTALAIATRKADLLFVVLAWAFVALRIAHALIHTRSNVVLHRFRAFVAGMAVLALMWIIFAVRALSG